MKSEKIPMLCINASKLGHCPAAKRRLLLHDGFHTSRIQQRVLVSHTLRRGYNTHLIVPQSYANGPALKNIPGVQDDGKTLTGIAFLE